MTTFRVDAAIDSLAALDVWASHLATLSQDGGVVILEGLLGAGKTTLIQHWCRYLGVVDPVTSPTFDLLHCYVAGTLTIYHVDGYRITDLREWDMLDLPAPDTPDTLILAEWGDVLKTLYDERLEIQIARAVSGEVRHVVLTGMGDRWSGKLEGLSKEIPMRGFPGSAPTGMKK